MKIILRKIHMILDTDYGHTKAKSLMVEEWTKDSPKWVLTVWSNIPQMPCPICLPKSEIANFCVFSVLKTCLRTKKVGQKILKMCLRNI